MKIIRRQQGPLSRKPGLFLAPVLFVLAALAPHAFADTTVGATTNILERKSFDKVDHSAWDGLLQKYVNEAGMVNYKGWKASASDMKALNSYLDNLSGVNQLLSSKAPARKAFWINAYNALTIYGILKVYPTSSIRKHTAKVFGYNIWKDLYLRVGDGKYNLHGMEHNILRKTGDFRIHFAIVCASIGCPRLLNNAYVASKLSSQLNENARNFFEQKRQFRYDKSTSTFYLSSILDWFAKDFGKTKKDQLKAISKYLPTEEAKAAALAGDVSIKYLDYNWDINKQ